MTSRRTFLALLAALPLASPLRARAVMPAGACEGLAACGVDLASARRLGGLAWQEQAMSGAAASRALENLEARWRAAGADPSQLAGALQQVIHEDFAAARVRRVDGWLLSDTEAAICLLAAGATA